MKLSKISFTVAIIISNFFLPLFSNAQSASRFYIENPSQTIVTKSDFFLDIYLDADKSVNAFNMSLSYVPDKVNFIDADDAGSIVSVWASSPKETSPGLISFSGGIINPFSGTRGFITKLHFRALTPGISQFSITSNNLYLANGLGTKIKAGTSDLAVSISEAGESGDYSPPILGDKYMNDTTPPELELRVATNLVDNTTLAVLYASDKESGIKETQMRTRVGFSWSAWKSVENFTSLAPGTWVVEGKALNRALLESSKRTYVWSEVWKETRIPIFALIAFIIIGFLVYFHYRRVYNKYKNPYARTDNTKV